MYRLRYIRIYFYFIFQSIDKFDKLISFLYSKLHNWYDKDDKYIEVVNDMYEDNFLDVENIKDLKLSKEKDDFER